MAELARRGMKSPAVRAAAVQITRGLRQKDYLAEARAVHEWVRDQVRYVRDVAGVETLHTADRLLTDRAGDCDDKSVLIAALLGSIGHRLRFVAVGFGRQGFAHVYPEALIGGRWWPLEATEPWPMGQGPSRPPARTMIENVTA